MPHPPGPGDAPPQPLPGLVGTSVAMQEVAATARRVAATDVAVLLVGETGTGKGLVARAIHELSARKGGPFVRVACGTLADDHLPGEIGAHFEAARGGTVFLDDVTAISPRLQATLLGILDERQAARARGAEPASGDARVIAASDRDLADEVARERFREDVAYRLGVVPVALPPLRARRDDIPALVAHFLECAARANGRRVVRMAPAAAESLCRHHWPGNVRELEAVVERCVVTAPGDEITPELLPPAIRGERSQAAALPGRGGDLDSLARDLVEQGLATAAPDDDTLFDRIVSRVERELIAQMLAACGGVQSKAATRLGINRNTLRKKLLEHGLEEDTSS